MQHKIKKVPSCGGVRVESAQMHNYIKHILRTAMVVCLSTTAWAGNNFAPVAASELTMTSSPEAPGASAILLYRQVDRNDQTNTPYEECYFRIKVLTEKGRERANVELPYVKGQSDVVSIKARVTHPDGKVIDFDGKIYDKAIVKSREARYQAKTFTLPDVQVGSVIEYSYRELFTNDDVLAQSHWTITDELYTVKASFSLHPYDHEGVRMRWRFKLEPGWAMPKQGPDKVVRLEVANVTAKIEEEMAPPEVVLLDYVDFEYYMDFVDNDVDKFWRTSAKKSFSEIEHFIGNSKQAQALAAKTVASGDSPEVKARKLFTAAQKLRNLSFEEEKSEQEMRRQGVDKSLRSVDDVLRNGFGYADMITEVYIGLLRAAGVKADAVLVSDRKKRFFAAGALNRNDMDDVAARVVIGDKEYYCTPGWPGSSFGAPDWRFMGAPARLLDKEGGKWIETALLDSSNSETRRTAKLKLDAESGSLEGDLTVVYTGVAAGSRRLLMRGEDAAARRKYLEDEVKAVTPIAVEVDLTNKPEWDSTEEPLTASFHFKAQGWATSAGRRVMMPATLFSAGEKHTFEHAERNAAIYVHYPTRQVDDIRIELPEGWSLQSTSPAVEDDKKIVYYSRKVAFDKGVLQMNRELRLDFMVLDKEYYTALRNFYQEVRTKDEAQVMLQTAGGAQ